jgi:hypothetical protein
MGNKSGSRTRHGKFYAIWVIKRRWIKNKEKFCLFNIRYRRYRWSELISPQFRHFVHEMCASRALKFIRYQNLIVGGSRKLHASGKKLLLVHGSTYFLHYCLLLQCKFAFEDATKPLWWPILSELVACFHQSTSRKPSQPCVLKETFSTCTMPLHQSSRRDTNICQL